MFLEVSITQGANLSIQLPAIKNTTTNTAINVASYVFNSQVRKSYYTQTISANLDCVKTDSANGILTLKLGSSNTASLEPRKYVFSVLGTYANNTVEYFDGHIIVLPGATR